MVIKSRPDVPFIPENITVHLDEPDKPAENITIPFPAYIKNVASNTVYPTWPEDAIKANILAIITFTLNRIYTEWYRSRGYQFDITSSPKYDQPFVPQKNIYDNISSFVDEMFTSYIIRRGKTEPAFTPYCDGKIKTCQGLSQWGSVELARQGYTPYQILQHYYGENIDIVTDVPVGTNFESYPLYPLTPGSFGRDVSIIQTQLNRIGQNYPTIPKITTVDGIFSAETENAVKEFQKIFRLTPTGIVDSATWYRIKYIYTEVKGLSDLFSEGIVTGEIQSPFQVSWQEGDSGVWVKLIQYYVRALACYYKDVPQIEITGYFGPETTEAVKALQTKYGIIADGVVGIQIWAKLDSDYKNAYQRIPPGCFPNKLLYPGYLIYRGMGDNNVTLMQTYLQKIAQYYPQIPPVEVTGIFDEQTEAAVKAFDQNFLGEGTGIIGPITWSKIAEIYESLP